MLSMASTGEWNARTNYTHALHVWRAGHLTLQLTNTTPVTNTKAFRGAIRCVFSYCAVLFDAIFLPNRTEPYDFSFKTGPHIAP